MKFDRPSHLAILYRKKSAMLYNAKNLTQRPTTVHHSSKLVHHSYEPWIRTNNTIFYTHTKKTSKRKQNKKEKK
jgi:hypothetical protein